MKGSLTESLKTYNNRRDEHSDSEQFVEYSQTILLGGNRKW